MAATMWSLHVYVPLPRQIVYIQAFKNIMQDAKFEGKINVAGLFKSLFVVALATQRIT